MGEEAVAGSGAAARLRSLLLGHLPSTHRTDRTPQAGHDPAAGVGQRGAHARRARAGHSNHRVGCRWGGLTGGCVLPAVLQQVRQGTCSRRKVSARGQQRTANETLQATAGVAACRALFGTAAAAEATAERLAAIAAYHGFEGWLVRPSCLLQRGGCVGPPGPASSPHAHRRRRLPPALPAPPLLPPPLRKQINIENSVDLEHIPHLLSFLRALTARMHAAAPGWGQVVW